MNALILGGTGFIGRRLARELAAAGHHVTLFGRRALPDGEGEGAPESRMPLLCGDRRSEDALRAALFPARFEVVWDLLCYDGQDADLMARLCLQAGVGRLVHVSTCSVYWCTGDFPCPVPEEDFDRFSEFERRSGSIEYAYGYAKRKAEERLMRACREEGLGVTIVRPPCVAGESDPTLRYASYCARIADGGPLILPDGGFVPFRHVYVGDLARGLAAIPSLPGTIGRAYNVASAEILSVRRIVEDIASLMSRRVDLVEIPGPLLAPPGHGSTADSDPASGEDAALFSPFSRRAPQVPAIERAIAEIGWNPTPYAAWIERTVRWWIDCGPRAGLPPPALRHRSRELELIAQYRRRFNPA